MSSEQLVKTSPGKLASLAMYDQSDCGLDEANDLLWERMAHLLQEQGVHEVPGRLTRNLDLDDVWSDQDLLIGQTCGYPLIKQLRDKVQLLATPCYDAPGCEGSSYRSAIITHTGSKGRRLSDLRGSNCVINSRSSNSGMNLLRAAVAPLAQGKAFFNQVFLSGSHLRSLEMVASGEADLAAIDCISFLHFSRHLPNLTSSVRIIEWTSASPGLPLITAITTDHATTEKIRAALQSLASDHSSYAVKQRLLLTGFQLLPFTSYSKITELEEFAIKSGYPEVA